MGVGCGQALPLFHFVINQTDFYTWREDILGLGRWAEPCLVIPGYLLMRSDLTVVNGLVERNHHIPGVVEAWTVSVLAATQKGPGEASLLPQLLLSQVRRLIIWINVLR